MVGGFYCPKCEKFNACCCESCSKEETTAKRVSWESNGEIMICGYCNEHFSPDQSLDMEFKLRSNPKTNNDV
jgi:predicted SprT family Zn-dependent metalloprotease